MEKLIRNVCVEHVAREQLTKDLCQVNDTFDCAFTSKLVLFCAGDADLTQTSCV